MKVFVEDYAEQRFLNIRLTLPFRSNPCKQSKQCLCAVSGMIEIRLDVLLCFDSCLKSIRAIEGAVLAQTHVYKIDADAPASEQLPPTTQPLPRLPAPRELFSPFVSPGQPFPAFIVSPGPAHEPRSPFTPSHHLTPKAF